MENDIYVVVCESNLPVSWKGMETQEVVIETMADSFSLESAKDQVERFNGRYGKTRIAKLVFVDEV